MSGYMKKPCEHCPFRMDIRPFLTPARGKECAEHALNPYNWFPCHKTTVADDETDEMLVTEKSKDCAGFMTLQYNHHKRDVHGFTPTTDVIYPSVEAMIHAHSTKLQSRFRTYSEYLLSKKEKREHSKSV